MTRAEYLRQHRRTVKRYGLIRDNRIEHLVELIESANDALGAAVAIDAAGYRIHGGESSRRPADDA